MLLPFEISCIKNIIAGTEGLLSFVDDGTCSGLLLKSIQNWIDTIRTNKFSAVDRMQINDFFDDCIRELENKKTFLRKELHIVIPYTISRKLYVKGDVLNAIREIELRLNSRPNLKSYLNSLSRESLLLTLSLIYFGRDSIPVDIPDYENMSDEECQKEKELIIADLNKSQLIESKMNELDETFEKDSFIVGQIMGKFSVLKGYLIQAKKIFNEWEF